MIPASGKTIFIAMQLTQHTDFGLRLLIVLARKDGPVSLPAFSAQPVGEGPRVTSQALAGRPAIINVWSPG